MREFCDFDQTVDKIPDDGDRELSDIVEAVELQTMSMEDRRDRLAREKGSVTEAPKETCQRTGNGGKRAQSRRGSERDQAAEA
jgi:hypothetical protein